MSPPCNSGRACGSRGTVGGAHVQSSGGGPKPCGTSCGRRTTRRRGGSACARGPLPLPSPPPPRAWPPRVPSLPAPGGPSGSPRRPSSPCAR
eukprot:15442142-Alexandrium_andersonii.AAC.1